MHRARSSVANVEKLVELSRIENVDAKRTDADLLHHVILYTKPDSTLSFNEHNYYW